MIIEDDECDKELRLGFDFDGVIADDTAETFYNESNGDMKSYFQHESQLASSPLSGGPIGNLLQKIPFFEEVRKEKG